MRNYTPVSWNRWIYTQALSVFRGYDDMVKAIKEIERDVIYGQPATGTGGGGIARPTESRALELANKKAEYERQIRAVDRALSHFDKADQRMLRQSFISGRSNMEMARIHHMSIRTVKRRKQRFVGFLAGYLHLI